MMSMRRMNAGDGYERPLRTITIGDGTGGSRPALTRHYGEEETPWGSKSSRVLFGVTLRLSVYCGGRGLSSDALAKVDVSCIVVAGNHHAHLLVLIDRLGDAPAVLCHLTAEDVVSCLDHGRRTRSYTCR